MSNIHPRPKNHRRYKDAPPYFTTFFLSTTEAASSLQLTGMYAADEFAEIYLNGGLTSLGSASGNSGFITGVNTLDFVVNNATSVGGLNVSEISLTSSAAHEPGTLSLLALGGVGLAVRLRHLK